MPRGKYPRKVATKCAQDISVQPTVQEDLTPPAQLVAPEFLVQPSFYRNKRVAVDAIEGDELKAYARSIGITQRDVDFLSVDRLRQNCKVRILESMED